MNLTEVDDSVLRVHFYDQSGASVVSDQQMNQGPVDVEQFGTPHNHRGNIAAVVPFSYCLTVPSGSVILIIK